MWGKANPLNCQDRQKQPCFFISGRIGKGWGYWEMALPNQNRALSLYIWYKIQFVWFYLYIRLVGYYSASSLQVLERHNDRCLLQHCTFHLQTSSRYFTDFLSRDNFCHHWMITHFTWWVASNSVCIQDCGCQHTESSVLAVRYKNKHQHSIIWLLQSKK